jgi:hypothetical protein
MRNLALELLILSLLSTTALASTTSASKTIETLPWTPRKEPSKLLRWITDPEHSWWKRNLLRRDSNTQPAIPTPTKCTYLPSNTDPVCNHGCICGNSGCAPIYFANLTKPVDNRPVYHVCTPWQLNHQSQLRWGLQQVGFSIVTNHTKCGWMRLSHVTELRVGRGNIDVNGTDELPFGDMAELAKIEEIMRREYPFVEILIILATLIGPIFLCFTSVIWFGWADKPQKGYH